MNYSLMQLFYREIREQEKILLTKINQKIVRKDFELTEAQVEELVDSREKTLTETHRLEFSWTISFLLANQLSQSSYIMKQDFFQRLLDLQELFYFIRMDLPNAIDDRSLVDKIVEIFNENSGFIANTQATLEEWLVSIYETGGMENEERTNISNKSI